ncbi:MAG TPA: oxygen-independent coproporphyrinogen III oxidase [Steroidobacteraceae bacterium]
MNRVPPFDTDLLARYDRPGPRYTSYPTAPQFIAPFDEALLREQALRSNQGTGARALSLYLHIPFCQSPCFYCGCNRVITRDEAKGTGYVHRLQQEIALAAPLFDRQREVAQLHLGGGTPNFLRPAQIEELLVTLREHFNLSNDPGRDFSIELDPRFVALGDIEYLARIGFNRASFGVQDFAPEVQGAINRVQSIEQTLSAIADCRKHHFRSVNVDLIYGLPRQTPRGFAQTLDTLLTVRPDRFAVYGYAHMPYLFKAQRQIDGRDLPDAAAKLQLLQLAIERLAAAGYCYIGMDHFALPEDELARAQETGKLHRNFMGYTTHADCDLMGFGVSAISHVGQSFTQNLRDMRDWEAALDAGRLPLWRGMELSPDDELRADVIQQLMCLGRIDIGATERRHRIDFLSYFSDALHQLHPLVADGLVGVGGSVIAVTPRGRLLVRAVAMCFDRYLPAAAQSTERPRYSTVV